MRIFIFRKKNILYILFILTVFISCSILYSFATTSHNDSSFIQNVNNIYSSKEKIAFLTFDDGPTIRSTPYILDILKEEDIKATFFVIGKYVEHHPDLVKRAYEEGHYLANHTYSHDNSILYKNQDNFINEIQKTDNAISEAIGIDYHSYLFRFPNGYMGNSHKKQKKIYGKILNDMGYAYIDWNCLNNDSIKKYSKAQLLNNLISSSKNKSVLVILMHDTKDVSDSSAVLKDSIDYLRSQGYSFKNFYDLK